MTSDPRTTYGLLVAAGLAKAPVAVSAAADDRDHAIVTERVAAYSTRPGPRVGDWVHFADGTQRRISYVWPNGAQTSDGGSFYLGNHGGDYSGSLWPAVPLDSLERTDETCPARVWIFHHDWWQAHNSVDFLVPFRVYRCDLPAPL